LHAESYCQEREALRCFPAKASPRKNTRIAHVGTSSVLSAVGTLSRHSKFGRSNPSGRSCPDERCRSKEPWERRESQGLPHKGQKTGDDLFVLTSHRKNPKFLEEQEWRLVLPRSKKKSPSLVPIKYRSASSSS
jgi:hypothetical protein